MECQRPYSIRTRIKTQLIGINGITIDNVRDHIPLEQGLRPAQKKAGRSAGFVRDHIPLEQGLRQSEL